MRLRRDFILVFLFGRTLVIKNCPPLFSERCGFEKWHRLGFGWRWRIERTKIKESAS